MISLLRRFLSATIVLGAACSAAANAQSPAAWLNVRDCGASGSRFETTASTTAGSNRVTVRDAGDFQVGQGVMLSKCNIRYTPTQLWGVGIPYQNSRPVGNSVEVRGYDGSAGSWVVYVLDIAAAAKPTIRWTDDLGRNWHANVAITHDWQPLSGGIEVRLNQRDWESGYVIAFGARDQLVTTIEKIEGKVLVLKDAANRTVADSVVRHNDTVALQAAVTRGLREKRNVYVPIGHYRLAHTVRVPNAAAITIEGQSAVDTVLDISDGEGSCFSLVGGTDVTIRNFRMLGFMGFADRDQAGCLRTRGTCCIWGFGLKHCNGITIGGTERVLVENCHASRMSGECFVSGGPSRGTARPGRPYSQAITWLRCSVTDCARNAFNDVMCGTENTCVLHCRVVDVGGCSWEGASRFVKFVGNYVRNGGTVAMGNLGPANHDDTYPRLGAGQHIIADNVFESNVPYGACAIRSAVGATQVIVRNNLFVNFNSSCVEATGTTDPLHYPSANTTITGNIFDLTCVGDKPKSRTAVNVSANDAIVSDNQVYVRGACDPLATGIHLGEPALNLNVHDNLVRGCGRGIVTARGSGQVAEVIDGQTFLRTVSPAGLPLDRLRPESCCGWTLAWQATGKGPAVSVIAAFEAETLRFRLKEARAMKAGDRFDVIAPSTNWTVHHNTVTGCLLPVVLNSYGSETAVLRDNVITRGEAVGVRAAVFVGGMFTLIGNQITGFDERPSTAFSFLADPLGRTARSVYRNNLAQRCTALVSDAQKPLWEAAKPAGNVCSECAARPDAPKTP
jgi:hypothetical protein